MDLHRLRIIVVFFIVFALVFVGRLVYLQVFCHDALAAKADAQEFHTVELEESPRGRITDCNGVSVTADTETASLLIVPSLIGDVEKTIGLLEYDPGLSSERLMAKIYGETEDIRREPFIAKTDLTAKEAEHIEELGLGGVYVVSRQGRYYRDFPLQHLLGTLGEDENSGEIVGLSGLERVYDDVLTAGSSGKISFLVDERNRMIDPGEYYLTEKETDLAGEVLLTVDLGIQRAAESALEGHSGAMVVLDSKNGDVLAMASAPKYDPYQVTDLLSSDAYVNKALSSYPPASLFKIFISAVTVENDLAVPETMFFCDGAFPLENGSTVSCWEEEGHGFLTFNDALSLSCNPVFVKMTLEIGKERLSEAFSRWELDEDRLLGYPLNDLSSLDFSGGTDADLANIGLGENGVKLTPLNVAKMINVIAADGLLYTPRVVTEVRDSEGNTVKSFNEALAVRVLSSSTAKTVTDMMAKTFESGTARKLHLESFHMAGKTGTSETGNVWIGGFFPYEDPEYTIVILVTGGHSGVGDGGPILKKLCAYLGNLP